MPGHVDIYDNEQTDKAAKIAVITDFNNHIIDCSNEIDIFLTYLKKMSRIHYCNYNVIIIIQ
jgi:hypothetical protein